MQIKPNRSIYYRFTTQDRNDPEIAALKANIALYNKGNPDNKLRVCLRGRKAKVKQKIYSPYTSQVFVRSYDHGGNVVGGLDNATEFDVYVYNRYKELYV